MKNLIGKLDKLEEVEYKARMKKEYSKKEKKVRNIKGKVPIEKLPFKFEALKRFVDSETISYHYNKYYIGYINKLNDCLSKNNISETDLEVLIRAITKYDLVTQQNIGGAYNHGLFWKMLSTKQQEATGAIMNMIQKSFGGIKEFRKKFESSAKECVGSGWVWLVLTKNGTLKITSTSNHDNPLMDTVVNGGFPLLGLDLWEHAYYLTYKDKKERYIENFWKVVNWDYVNERLKIEQNRNMSENMNDNETITEEPFNRENWGSYLSLYKQNIELFQDYGKFVDTVLSEVFHDNSKTTNGIIGVYDIEAKGWSVLNKLNTNMLGFAILVGDLNRVLEKSGMEKINLLDKNLTKSEIKIELNRLMGYIDLYKNRIFDRNSKLFKKLISALSETTKKGDITENISYAILIKKFGETNVTKISGYGERKDMIGGIDVEVHINGLLAQAQIKPTKEILKEDGRIIITPSSTIRQYKTDWLIFEKDKKLYIFGNKNTKIVEGKYVFDNNDLLYILD